MTGILGQITQNHGGHIMLVFTCRTGGTLYIGDDATATTLGAKAIKVRIGITASQKGEIDRGKIHHAPNLRHPQEID